MAETFKNQVDALTGFAGTEDDALTDWLQAGTREIINILPPNLKEYCYSKQTFTSAAANSEAETMITGQLGSVYAGSVECRQIRPKDKHKASSSTSIEYASATDPVYYVEGNKINILPASSSGIYYVIANPTVAHGSTSIDNFPNEAEYLVTLYASVRALQRLMNNLNSNSDITTAFTYAKAGLDQAETALDKFEAADGDSIFGDEATFLTADSQLAHVSDALIKAQNLIDGATMSGDTEPQSAQYWLNDEDTEMVQATLQTAQTEIQRAQTSIQHWVSIGDMRAKQANAALAEANGYISEAKIRMERDSQKYQWYQTQQLKLQQDYDKGIQMLAVQGIPQPTQQQGRQ